MHADRSSGYGMHVYLLGPIEVTCSGRRVELNGRHQRALMAVLASELGKVVGTGRLIEAIWGDNPPKHARTKLQGCVSAVRKSLSEFWAPDANERSSVATRDPGYMLTADTVTVDLLEYRTLIRQATVHLDAGQITAAAQSLAGALALWRGPAFADARTPVLDGLADSLERGRLFAVERKAECDLQLGRHEDVAEELTATMVANPLRERMRALLMLALYRSGCRAEALECYRVGRHLLHEQLGIEPDQKLQRFHLRILADDLQLSFQDWLPWADGLEPSESKMPNGQRRPL
jgi:DNA-binding SARP family transcriptional activator